MLNESSENGMSSRTGASVKLRWSLRVETFIFKRTFYVYRAHKCCNSGNSKFVNNHLVCLNRGDGVEGKRWRQVRERAGKLLIIKTLEVKGSYKL